MNPLKIISCLVLLVLLLMFSVARAADSFAVGQELPRSIVALYDSKFEGDPRYTLTHQYLEMPLNYMGYILEYHDIRKPLPKLDDSVRGVTVWFLSDTILKDPLPLFDWLHAALDQKKKLLVMGGLGVSEEFRESEANIKQLNKLMHRIGVHDRNNWINIVHDAEILAQNLDLTNFERSFEGELTPYLATNRVDSRAKSHLQLKAPQYSQPVSDLIITNENGGYVANNYGVYQLYGEDDELVLTQWFINPFLFLREVFDDEYLPKPDTTTLNGKRIFYSHLDGDGWNNLSEVAKYKKKKTLSSEVLYEEVFKPYDDFAFTVGLIVSEIRRDCYGVPDSLPVAEKTMKLYNVEPGSHTYSHPLYWGYFADADPLKEKEYLDKYPSRPQGRFFLSEWILGAEKDEVKVEDEYDNNLKKNEIPLRGIRDPSNSVEDLMKSYDTPRSYACDSFNLDKEIRGSIDYIEKLSGGKKVRLYQWSGNTTPFEAAIRETRNLGLYNMNGGDSRFDTEYPSYATVAPLSTVVGDERQIYSSNSNENTYTNLWTDRFFGFKYLQTTVNNTESPLRVAPYNLYFHTYSGEKEVALTAVKENLEFARKQNLIPIFASDYAAVATSFFDTKVKKEGKNRWKILDRGDLQTIRFDKATLKQVDFQQSSGVIGQNYYQGSLYVSLDAKAKEPVIQLKSVDNFGERYNPNSPYLIESNWEIKGLHFGKNSLIFVAAGFGKSDILIQLPKGADAKIQLHDSKKVYREQDIKADIYNQIRLVIDNQKKPVGVTILLVNKKV